MKSSPRVTNVFLAIVMAVSLFPAQAFATSPLVAASQSASRVLVTGIASSQADVGAGETAEYTYNVPSEGVYYFLLEYALQGSWSDELFTIALVDSAGKEWYSRTSYGMMMKQYGSFVLRPDVYTLKIDAKVPLEGLVITPSTVDLEDNTGVLAYEREDNGASGEFDTLAIGKFTVGTVFSPAPSINNTEADFDDYRLTVSNPNNKLSLRVVSSGVMDIHLTKDSSFRYINDIAKFSTGAASGTTDFEIGNISTGEYYIQVTAKSGQTAAGSIYALYMTDAATPGGSGGSDASGGTQPDTPATPVVPTDSTCAVLMGDSCIWSCDSEGTPVYRNWGSNGDWKGVKTLYVEPDVTTVPQRPRCYYKGGADSQSFPLYVLMPDVEKVVFKLDGTGKSSVANLGKGAFAYMSLASSFENFDKTQLALINDDAFHACSSLRRISLPSTLAAIGKYAFWECYQLSEIELPKSCASVGDRAFDGCTLLSKVTVNSKSVASCGSYAFEDTMLANSSVSGAAIYVPGSLVNKYKSAANWSSYKSRIKAIPGTKVPATPKADATCALLKGDGSLYTCTKKGTVASAMWGKKSSINKVKTLYVAADVKSVPYSLHYRYGSKKSWASLDNEKCNVTKVVFLTNSKGKSSCKQLSWHSFCDMGKLATVKGLEKTSVKKIADMSFSNCAKLKSISVPKTLKKIGKYAFFGCKKLKKIGGLNARKVSIHKDAFALSGMA